MTHDNFSSNLIDIKARINTACSAFGRNPSDVNILPVSKFHPYNAVLSATNSGFYSFGENRIAELIEKKAACAEHRPTDAPPLHWELIGHLQTNKARLAAAHADRIQSVDSIKLLQRLSNLCAELERPQLPVLLQINAGNDPAKFGVDLSDAPALLDAALSLPHIQVDGLMTIAPLDDDLDVAEACFTNLRQLRDGLQTTHKVSLPVLSMGMTNDLERAIRAGSTQLRIGTALFGERQSIKQ